LTRRTVVQKIEMRNLVSPSVLDHPIVYSYFSQVLDNSSIRQSTRIVKCSIRTALSAEHVLRQSKYNGVLR